jgi:hypothetical protein
MDHNSPTSPETASDPEDYDVRVTGWKKLKLEETLQAQGATQTLQKSTKAPASGDTEVYQRPTKRILVKWSPAEVKTCGPYGIDSLEEHQLEHKESQKLLDALAADRLPPELVLCVMKEVVKPWCNGELMRIPYIRFEIRSARELVDIRQKTMGDSESSIHEGVDRRGFDFRDVSREVVLVMST